MKTKQKRERAAYQRRWRNSPVGRAYLESPEYRAAIKAYTQTPEYAAARKVRYKIMWADPTHRARIKAWNKKYQASPKGRAMKQRYEHTPKRVAARRRQRKSPAHLKILRDKYHRRAAQQLCRRCKPPVPAVPGKTLCRHHLEYTAAWHRKKRLRNDNHG